MIEMRVRMRPNVDTIFKHLGSMKKHEKHKTMVMFGFNFNVSYNVLMCLNINN